MQNQCKAVAVAFKVKEFFYYKTHPLLTRVKWPLYIRFKKKKE